jgi:YaiO family outer membrane protein
MNVKALHIISVLFLSSVITMALSTLALQPASGGDLESGNERIHAGEYAGAVAAFRAALVGSPANRDARYGLARALSFSGDVAGGEREYRAVLAVNPGDAECRLGLSDVLAWQKKYGESQEVLAALAADRPEDVDVILRQGKVSLWAGDLSTARLRFGKVLSLSPGNAEATRGLAAVEAAVPATYLRELEAGVSLLRIRNGNPGTQVWTAFREKTHKPYEFSGKVEYLHRFGKDEGRGTLGAVRKWESGRSLRGEASVSPGAEVYPRFTAEGELAWPLTERLAGYGGVKRAVYASADTWSGSAALEYYLLPKNAPLFLRYGISRSRFDSGGGSTDGTWLVKVTHCFNDYDRIWAFYSRGTEGYASGTADQIGNVSNDSYGAGGKVFLRPAWGVEGGIDWQERQGGGRYVTLTAILIHRF